jgi:hypothetical protein
MGCPQDNIDHIGVFLMTAGSASNTFSMPLLGESKPNVSSTFLPSTPNLSLLKLGSINGVSGMP